MEILARFKEWASVEEVRDWICKDWVSLEERERELMEFYGYEEPTAASPAPSAESSPAAEPAPDLRSSEAPVPSSPGEGELREGGKANQTAKPARYWLDPAE